MKISNKKINKAIEKLEKIEKGNKYQIRTENIRPDQLKKKYYLYLYSEQGIGCSYSPYGQLIEGFNTQKEFVEYVNEIENEYNIKIEEIKKTETEYFKINGKEKEFRKIHGGMEEYGILYKNDEYKSYKLKRNHNKKDIIEINANSDEEAIKKYEKILINWIENGEE